MSQPPLSPFVSRNGFVFTSGQVYLTPEGKLLEGSISDQAHQVMKNLEKVLTDAGTSFTNVVKTTIYVTDMSIYGELNEVYASYFKDSYPAREVIGVKELPLGAKIEISMIAIKS
jgi:2-iminobutanoate/2-iminopropanoate deaminase